MGDKADWIKVRVRVMWYTHQAASVASAPLVLRHVRHVLDPELEAEAPAGQQGWHGPLEPGGLGLG